MDNLFVGYASHQETLISNTSIPNSINVLPEIIFEGYASRYEPDGLSVGHASWKDPLVLNESFPKAINVLLETVSDGHTSRYVPYSSRTKKEIEKKLEEIRT